MMRCDRHACLLSQAKQPQIHVVDICTCDSCNGRQRLSGVHHGAMQSGLLPPRLRTACPTVQGTALVKSAGREGVALAWNSWQEPAPPAPVTLILAMPRPKVLKRLYRHIPELGVKQIVRCAPGTLAERGSL